jgi:membrane-bound lytic murein transglycosylase F
MQIMPSTYADLHKKSPYLSAGTLSDPRWNIAAGIFYDRILYKRWDNTLKFSTTENDLYMTFASYKAELREYLKKQKNSRAVLIIMTAGAPSNSMYHHKHAIM